MQLPIFVKYASPEWLNKLMGKEEPDYVTSTLTGAGIGTGLGAGGLAGTTHMYNKAVSSKDTLTDYLKAFKSTDDIQHDQLMGLRDLSRKTDLDVPALQAEFDFIRDKANKMHAHRASKTAELEGLPDIISKWKGRNKFMTALLPLLAIGGAGAGALHERYKHG